MKHFMATPALMKNHSKSRQQSSQTAPAKCGRRASGTDIDHGKPHRWMRDKKYEIFEYHDRNLTATFIATTTAPTFKTAKIEPLIRLSDSTRRSATIVPVHNARHQKCCLLLLLPAQSRRRKNIATSGDSDPDMPIDAALRCSCG